MTLKLSHLIRRFAGTAGLDDVSLDIAPGEFLALLGPSGSGKTTLLRILAGLDYPDGGSVMQGDRDLLKINARQRSVGLVFQHYALFRHMTVADNVAFGLRVRPARSRPSRTQIAERVEALLKRVHLEGYGKRYPAQLSGGQRQRVALARALAVEPELLLLDEPFGALDAQVRVSLRRWLRHLHEELGLTTVFVTHDQEEALELADRVAVMNNGRIEQVDTPEMIYQQPATPFVCEFIGKVNRLTVERRGGQLVSGSATLCDDPWDGRYERALAYVRPEQLALSAHGQGDSWEARLRHIYPAGSVTHLELQWEEPDQVLEMDIASEQIARLSLRQDMTLRVRPKVCTLFPLDVDGHVQASDRVMLRWDV
ncbi:sulfate/molybdate ABC transporter ATP-binding protein [Dyella sp.]|uniref:sulfate/molybdate ABC transporter ATP-binding protein n=1 Tax=Dyella sp. TaxID=1869338 RepID=UPI0039C89363